MEVDLCAMADHASSGEGGKLTLVGVFDRINVQEFPAAHASMALVLRTKAQYPDREEKHPLLVTFEKPNGEKILRLEGEIPVGAIEAGIPAYQNTIVNVNNLPLEDSGTYVWRVQIDGEPKTSKDLLVRQK